MQGSRMSFLWDESSDDFAGELLCSCLWGSTDVTWSTGLSEGFADELEAENNLPRLAPICGEGRWGREGQERPAAPGSEALPGCSHCPDLCLCGQEWMQM